MCTLKGFSGASCSFSLAGDLDADLPSGPSLSLRPSAFHGSTRGDRGHPPAPRAPGARSSPLIPLATSSPSIPTAVSPSPRPVFSPSKPASPMDQMPGKAARPGIPSPPSRSFSQLADEVSFSFASTPSPSFALPARSSDRGSRNGGKPPRPSKGSPPSALARSKRPRGFDEGFSFLVPVTLVSLADLLSKSTPSPLCHPMNCLCWNARGAWRRQVKDFISHSIRSLSLRLIAMQETHIDDRPAARLIRSLGRSWQGVAQPFDGASWGLILA
ncbi:hypothetical protein Cni_G01728 [Canna indica]|uniref:Uncharacterized protein n=1 Tax=Canna indica TaxID=4628 RepID=A0AAQ3JRA1_9LILI|nr:hypothetical protein Cni_G01728 [Canna indica]